MRAVIQMFTVMLKELRELLSRPWQALTLILGPLAVMVAFGIGSNTSARPPRAIVVVPPGQEEPRLLRDYQRQFDQYLTVVDYTSDTQAALAALRRGSVEAVVELPPTPFETIASGKKATINVIYDDIDPLWRWVVPNFTQVMAGELNREIFVQTITEQLSGLKSAAQDTSDILRLLEIASDAADLGDRVKVQRALREALQRTDTLTKNVNAFGPEAAPLILGVQQLQEQLQQADQRLTLENAANAAADERPLKEQLGLTQTKQNLQQLATTLDRFTTVPPDVIISPLQVSSRNAATFEPDILSFFAPGILAMLVQHIAVSMGSLAFVRERLSGGFDLYTVAPIRQWSLLIGKYGAYSFFTLLIAAAVMVLLMLGLNVPLLGNPWLLILALALLTVSSVGIGLILSLLATSERQAVQFAMLVLLAVFFFSGFTLPLRLLLPVGQGIAYTLPATYGIGLMRDIMLRGAPGQLTFFVVLGGMSVLFFAVSLSMLYWRTKAQ